MRRRCALPVLVMPPRDVVADASLSKDQKVEALDTLEQDARQMSEAASEGMAGGERNKLREVLEAKDTLALQPLNEAYRANVTDVPKGIWGLIDTQAGIGVRKG